MRVHLTRFAWLYVLIFAACYFWLTQFSSPNLVDRDGHYHIKYAYLMRTEGLLLRERWLTFTILKGQLLDHHFLYHVLLIPFTFGDLRLGAKLAAFLFSTLVAMVFYVVLSKRGIPCKGFWILLLFSSSYPFLYRMSMTRVQAVSLIVLLLLFLMLVKERPAWVFILTALYVWLHLSASVFGVCLALLYVITTVIVGEKPAVKLLVFAFAGWVAGYLLNPSFPADVHFAWSSMTHKLALNDSVRVGNEWYGYDTSFLVHSSGLTFLALLFGIIMATVTERKVRTDTLFALLISSLFFAATMRSRRFVEYWPPFTLLFCALATRDFIASAAGSAVTSRLRRGRSVLVASLILGTGFCCARTFRELLEDIVNRSPRTERYGPGAHWLATHAREGETIFNTRWDDFPEFFFHNSHNAFIVGLDPGYMAMKNPKLYQLWRRVAAGNVLQPAKIVRSRFRCRFVFTNNEQEDLIKKLSQEKGVRRVFHDGECSVFEISPASRGRGPSSTSAPQDPHGAQLSHPS